VLLENHEHDLTLTWKSSKKQGQGQTLQMAQSSSYSRSSTCVASGSAPCNVVMAVLSLMKPLILFEIALNRACQHHTFVFVRSLYS